MHWKKKLLKKSRLYAILDKKVCGRRGLIKTAGLITKSKVSIVQLRDKESRKAHLLKTAFALSKIFSKSKQLFIINDYLDVAKIIDSDGVHLGQEDASVGIARKILGKDKIIGVSCHNLKQAIAAQKQGADYIGFGPIFSTPTKPDTKAIGLGAMKEIKEKIHIPVFVIGGINVSNIAQVLSAGAEKIAACRALCNRKCLKLN